MFSILVHKGNADQNDPEILKDNCQKTTDIGEDVRKRSPYALWAGM
jgi:hypothetical protein